MFRPLLALWLAALLLAPGVMARPALTDPTPAPRPSDPPAILALWITRWDFRTPADVRSCITRAESIGATDLFWQVRGQADAYYKSTLEPWGRELFRDLPKDATDPGFDPLALAVSLAHERGMRLHAWVNIMPLWKGKDPPSPADKLHPFYAHPEWRLRDETGAPQALNDHYVIVNPLLPAVHDHIVAVCRDIVARYPVDGLHMDYIRFVSDSMTDPSAYPRDPDSIGLFSRASGRAWSGSPDDLAAYRDFKRDRITALVKRIRSEAIVNAPRPDGAPPLVLTAAVWRRPELARDSYLQDAPAWLNDGTLDRACPMIYTKDDKQFDSDLTAWRQACPAKVALITPGVGIYLHAPGASGKQFDLAAAAGSHDLALFAYSALFESVDPNQDKSKDKVAERAERLRLILGEIRAHRPASAPAPSSP